jgi:hypothetical protein
MAHAEAYSINFVDSARAEADRLRLEATRLRTAADEHVRLAERLGAQALEVEHRVRELDELLGRAPQLRLDLPSEGLRGQQLRDAAITVLARRRGVGETIHYRDWFQLLLENGHTVKGKDPLATFLTQVTRSPLVVRAEAPGVYRIDAVTGAAQALTARRDAETALAEAHAAYHAALEQAPFEGEQRAGSEEVAELEANVTAAQRSLDEAERKVKELARAQALLNS